MTLNEWLDREGRGAMAWLARETGLTYMTIHNLMAGRARASSRSAIAIWQATKEEVDLLSLLIPSKAKRSRVKRKRAA